MSGRVGDLDAAQEAALVTVQALVAETAGLDPEYYDDHACCRFLRARSFDAAAAFEMIQNNHAWREEYKPNDIPFEGPVEFELGLNKTQFMGHDKDGRPAFIFWVGRHYKAESPAENMLALIVWVLEYLIARMPPGVEEASLILDYTDWGYKNMDNDMTKVIVACLQDNYPERLGRAFICNAPWIFKAAYKVVSPFMDAKTKSKIVFTGSDYETALLEYFDVDQLATTHGGEKECNNEDGLKAFFGGDMDDALDDPAGVGAPATATDLPTYDDVIQGDETGRDAKGKTAVAVAAAAVAHSSFSSSWSDDGEKNTPAKVAFASEERNAGEAGEEGRGGGGDELRRSDSVRRRRRVRRRRKSSHRGRGEDGGTAAASPQTERQSSSSASSDDDGFFSAEG